MLSYRIGEYGKAFRGSNRLESKIFKPHALYFQGR